ncbi:ATP-dependent DNA ligase [Streptomyces pilosus]|uniref:ATP-dependent DNA ligase n=1 Tax=Streptomyces pilosus TaxID=28893 RepID=UPI00362B8E62
MEGICYDVDSAGPDADHACARFRPASRRGPEPKWDGYRAQLARYADGRVLLRSRQGTDVTASFPEMVTSFRKIPLTTPLTLCPSTTDPATAGDWLTWTSAGLEGLCFKRLSEPYRAGTRAWGKYTVRATTEAIVGAITGSAAAPRTLLLGRYDDTGGCATPAVPSRLPAPRPPHSRNGW